MAPLIFGIFFVFVGAGITTIDLQLKAGRVIYQKFGGYDIADSPFGGDEAFINFNVSFSMSKKILEDSNETLGEILLFHSSKRPSIGYGEAVLEKKSYCCSSDLFYKGLCQKLNSLIINSELGEPDVFYDHLNFSSYRHGTPILQKTYLLKHTGIWYIFIANCNMEIANDIGASGILEWKNPYGYLSGQILGFLPLYWIMATIYFAILIVWIIFAIRYRKDMMDLQHGIAAVILISFIENLLWSINYMEYNRTGSVSLVLNIFGALFSSSKLSLIRTLMLLVAIGYTITRPVLTGGYKIAIISLTIFYFVTTTTDHYIEVQETSGIPVSRFFKFCAFALLSIANFIFLCWIGVELFLTFRKLKKDEEEKLSMYKKLAILLGLSCVLSTIIFFFELTVEWMDTSDTYFRIFWLWEGYWEFIYCSCIAFVSWVWRPSDRNSRYSYGKVGEDEEMDHAEVELEETRKKEEENENVSKTNMEEEKGNSEEEAQGLVN